MKNNLGPKELTYNLHGCQPLLQTLIFTVMGRGTLSGVVALSCTGAGAAGTSSWASGNHCTCEERHPVLNIDRDGRREVVEGGRWGEGGGGRGREVDVCGTCLVHVSTP